MEKIEELDRFLKNGNGKMITVRLISKNNAVIKTIFKIDKDAFGENSLNIWSLSNFIEYGRVFGLFVNSSLKGYIIFIKSWDNPQLVYLKKIAIDKKSHDLGYGSYLLLKTLLKIKKEGITTVVLTVDPNNKRALHIYTSKFGFEVVEYKKNEYGVGQDRLFIRLNLKMWNGKINKK